MRSHRSGLALGAAIRSTMSTGETAMADDETPTAEQQEPKQELYNGKTFQELPLDERIKISEENFLKAHPEITPEQSEEMSMAFGF